MPLVKIGERHQVTIPITLFKRLRLKAGDVLEAVLKENSIVLVPSTVIPKEEEWLHTEEWQKRLKEAEEDVQEGRVSGPFKTSKALISHLRNQK